MLQSTVRHSIIGLGAGGVGCHEHRALGRMQNLEKIGVIGEVGLRHSGRPEAWVIVVAHFKRLGARIDMVVSLKHHIDPKVVNQRCQRLPNAPDIRIFERMVAL